VSKWLQDALGLVELAGIGTALQQMINDPAAAEAAYAGLLQGVYTQGRGDLNLLLSL
jgi:hypothetical protein